MQLASGSATLESFAQCEVERTGITMTSKKSIVKKHDEELELEETELDEEEYLDRTPCSEGSPYRGRYTSSRPG